MGNEISVFFFKKNLEVNFIYKNKSVDRLHFRYRNCVYKHNNSRFMYGRCMCGKQVKFYDGVLYCETCEEVIDIE